MPTLSERSAQHVWHPFTQMQTAPLPIGLVRGEGSMLYDEEGKGYIDAIASWWVNTHGHAHPYIAEKVSEQLRTLEHSIFAGFTHPAAVELSERILALLGHSGHQFDKVFFSDNGSTAIEVGLKMAMQYWHNQGQTQRRKILALDGAYHGDTFGAMSAGGRGVFSAPFQPFLFAVQRLPFPGDDSEGFLEALEVELAGEDTCCFIYEPLVQGAGGMRMYAAEVLEKALALCKQRGVLLIADEVMTGFGRTGKYFASQHCPTQPDIVALSKGLTAGTLPLSLTCCTQAVYEPFLSADKTKAFFHGHSFTANPVGCAAALASLDLLLDPACDEARAHIAERHAAFALELKDNPLVKRVRQQGTILAMDVESGDATGYFNELRDWLYDFFIERGLLLRPLGNTVYILPPYCITDAELDQVYEGIRAALAALAEPAAHEA